jgi:hypothetical protein
LKLLFNPGVVVMEAKGIASFYSWKGEKIAVRLSEASHPRAFGRKGGFVRVSSGHVRVFSFESMSFEATRAAAETTCGPFRSERHTAVVAGCWKAKINQTMSDTVILRVLTVKFALPIKFAVITDIPPICKGMTASQTGPFAYNKPTVVSISMTSWPTHNVDVIIIDAFFKVPNLLTISGMLIKLE